VDTTLSLAKFQARERYMTTKRQQHSRQYKIEAVRLVINSGKSVATIAGELGIRADQLYRWKREFSQSAGEAFRGNGVMRSEDDEIARLRRELKRVTDERDFLKKTAAYFAKERR